jgi:FKBP-type peptidyl-prolyl cis-trans isomerase
VQETYVDRILLSREFALLMKSTLSLACAALAVVAPLSAQTEKAAKPADKPAAAGATAPMDKVSYFIGTQFGGNLKNQTKTMGVELDVENLVQAVRDQFEGKQPKFKEEELKAAMEAFEAVMKGKQAEMEKEKMAKAGDVKAAGEKFLVENAKRPGVTTTASGLQYEVLKKGEGAKPVPTDKVNVHYHGTLLSGKVFDSSVDRGMPITFGVQEVIKGWTEALQLMPVGSKWKIFIPSGLAYGDNGAGPDIGPGETLVFEVELLKIEK